METVAQARREPFLAPAHLSSFVVPSGMARSQFRAMGTTVSLLLLEEQSEDGTALVQDLFDEWERTLSRFLSDSELSQLNKRAGAYVMVSPLLYNVMEEALEAARATQGLFDPTLLYQLQQMGYDRSFEMLDLQQPANEQAARPGGAWRSIELDRYRQWIHLPEGVGVDFGGIAKGMAVDTALALLQKEGITPAMVNAGGDLSVVGTPPHETSWPIAIEGRVNEGTATKTGSPWLVPLQYGSMATSGIARRHWQKGNTLRHHLVDPRSGVSAHNNMESVSVVAARCEQAEVAAKVAFLMGMERGSKFLHNHGLSGLLVQRDGTWKTVGSWPRNEEMAAEQKEDGQ